DSRFQADQALVDDRVVDRVSAGVTRHCGSYAVLNVLSRQCQPRLVFPTIKQSGFTEQKPLNLNVESSVDGGRPLLAHLPISIRDYGADFIQRSQCRMNSSCATSVSAGLKARPGHL